MESLSLEVVPLAYMLRKLAGGRGKERKQKRKRGAGSSGGERWGHCLYAEGGQQWRRGVVPLPICQACRWAWEGEEKRRTESVQRAAAPAIGKER